MCYGCYMKEGAPVLMTDAVKAIAPRIRDADSFGGLHIVVEDWNLEDEDIQWCVDRAEGITESERQLGRDMLALSFDERVTAMALADGYIDPRDALEPYFNPDGN